MKKIAAVLFCLFFILALAAHSSAQWSWAGKYEYGENAGRNAGGTVIFIHHEITIEKNGDKLSAFITSQGYQTSKALKCTAKVVGNKLQIYFEDYGTDNIYEPFEPGDLLLTLERGRIGGKSAILTYWHKFEPSALAKWKTGGVYFRKSHN